MNKIPQYCEVANSRSHCEFQYLMFQMINQAVSLYPVNGIPRIHKELRIKVIIAMNKIISNVVAVIPPKEMKIL